MEEKSSAEQTPSERPSEETPEALGVGRDPGETVERLDSTSGTDPANDALGWPQPSGDSVASAFYPDPSDFHEQEEEAPRAKPFLARLLNRTGIHTGRGVDWMLDWIQVLAVAAFLAWLTMSYVVVRMRVPTGSMEPSIHAGSSFFVDKLSFYIRSPQPGDIIVFWHNESANKRVRYVKRMIATAGQTVQIKDCVKNPPETCGVYIDGQKLPGAAFDRLYYASGKMGDEVWTVPEGHYFALGDNSRNSLDSRFWGFVDQNDFIGEPFLRVWPLNQFGFMNGYFGSAP